MTMTDNNTSTAHNSVQGFWGSGFAIDETRVPVPMNSPTVTLSPQGSLAWLLEAAGSLGGRSHRREIDGLRGLVLQLAKQVNTGTLVRVAPLGAGIAFEPGTLLAILTYCYSSGIYGSQDIEHLMTRDSEFRKLCQNEFPRWRAIRRFRRNNCHAIERCLADVLSGLGSDALVDGSGPAMRAAGLNPFRTEAAWRIDIARVMDLMSEDD